MENANLDALQKCFQFPFHITKVITPNTPEFEKEVYQILWSDVIRELFKNIYKNISPIAGRNLIALDFPLLKMSV